MSQQAIGVNIPLSIIPREQELYKIGQNHEMPTVDIHNKLWFDQNFDNKIELKGNSYYKWNKRAKNRIRKETKRLNFSTEYVSIHDTVGSWKKGRENLVEAFRYHPLRSSCSWCIGACRAQKIFSNQRAFIKTALLL